MDVRRLQRANIEFQRKATEAEVEVKGTKVEASSAAKVEELNAEAASLKQQLDGSEVAVAVHEYIAYFHETTKYDGLGLYWREVVYDEVFKRLIELHPQLDLATVKKEFILAKLSISAEEGKASRKLGNEGVKGIKHPRL
ncbi:Hypothetical predicted protein [Olea europaea subsp. europaea]|uniref:Uncharacterized protein n=1 Tax=Olea europaea subsp. europaea TaxID=158383 RepID=A0A8S0U713_OLEEU|nr:Hypothetical predicted protein [Olea europaea subsp. europaea]